MLGAMGIRLTIHKKTVVLLVGAGSRSRFRPKNAIGRTGYSLRYASMESGKRRRVRVTRLRAPFPDRLAKVNLIFIR